MEFNNQLSLNEFDYPLLEEKIAKFPINKRDESKLLVCKGGNVTHDNFYNLSNFIPKESLLVLNNTKVIPARLLFKKESGAVIEIFLLNPILPSKILSQVLEEQKSCTWHCIIGNKKKWKNQEVLKIDLEINSLKIGFSAQLIDLAENHVRFDWHFKDQNNKGEYITFAEIVTYFGNIPLPPYLNREAVESDLNDYQTVYSKIKGAVAAPTAGLHFTDRVFEQLKIKNIACEYVTLHVSAGTFLPIKEENVLLHKMHNEQIVFSKSNIENLILNKANIIAVGTTSLRALESLFWYGVKLLENKESTDSVPFFIEKLYPYRFNEMNITLEESLNVILRFMDKNSINEIIGETEIFIFPGYVYRVIKGLITNFHQPKSTLILLVAALIGDKWRDVYSIALKNNYRFLSYGDSSLLIP